MKEKNLSKEDLAVQEEIARLEKLHGKGTVIGGDTVLDVERCPSGSLALDIALGGGYGMGRIVEFYGEPSSGKSTLSIEAAIQAQKKYPNKWVGIIDFENALDRNYSENLGLNMNRVKISQPDNAEQGLDIALGLIETGAFSMVIVDSIAAATPKAEIEGEMTDSQMGLQARLFGKFLRKVTGMVGKTNTLLVLISQTRTKLGIVYGDPTETSGGKAPKFFASQRIEIKKIAGGDKDGEEVLNNKTKCTVKKNKIAPPFKTAEFFIGFGTGIDKIREIVTIGSEMGIIQKAGSWYSYENTKLGQGEATVTTLLKDNPELCEEIIQKIKSSL